MILLGKCLCIFFLIKLEDILLLWLFSSQQQNIDFCNFYNYNNYNKNHNYNNNYNYNNYNNYNNNSKNLEKNSFYFYF